MTAKCEYHDKLDALQAACGERLSRAAQVRLFDRLTWWQGLHRHCLPGRQLVIALTSDETSGALCCLPLMRQGRFGLTALANWYNFSFAPVFDSADSESERLALLRSIAATLPRKGAIVTLAPLPDEDGSATLIERAFADAGWLVSRETCDENHVLEVRGRSFDEYWATRPGQMRSTLRRKAKSGLVDVRVETRYSAQSWADYERVYAQSWKPEEGSPAFLKALAQQESDAGCLRLGLAYIEGAPVAAQFWTVENGVALIHKLAHVESATHASPGTLLSAALFRHVIDEDRVRQVDFGTGSDRYKADWMEDVRPRYRLTMHWPRSPASWPSLARRWLTGLVRQV